MYIEFFKGFWTLFADGRPLSTFANLARAISAAPEAEVLA